MGVTAKHLLRIMDENLLPPAGAVIDLGTQQVHCDKDTVGQFIHHFTGRDDLGRRQLAHFANGRYFGELLTECGFAYRSLDLINGYNTTLLDLNLHPAPEELCGCFDLVTNFGTTEHLINQLLAMKTVHDLAKPGGTIYHDLPMSGYLEHGYFLYTPLFFSDLAAANEYHIVRQRYSRAEKPGAAPAFMQENGFTDRDFTDFGIEFILRKTSDAPFRLPLDPTTSLSFDPTVWESGAAGYSSGQATALERVSGWELQRALLARYRQKLALWFNRRSEPSQ